MISRRDGALGQLVRSIEEKLLRRLALGLVQPRLPDHGRLTALWL